MSRRYTSETEVACTICGRVCNLKGIASHYRSHDRQRREQAIDAAARQEAQVADPHFPSLGSWVEYRWNSEADQWPEDSDQRSGDSDDDPEDSDYEYELQPLTFDVEYQLDRVVLNDPSVLRDEEEPSKYMKDDIRTQYHLHSGRPDRIDHFEDYGRDEDAIKDQVHDLKPTAKFGTQTEFEFAEVCLKGRLNNAEIDGMLKVIQKVNKDDSEFTFRTHNDVQNAWDIASRWYAPFKTCTLSDTFDGKEFTYPLLHRDPVQWGLDLAADPNFARHMKWDARKLEKWDPSTNSFKRFIHEPWTADLWAEIQDMLPPNAKPLCYVFYADKTKLSSTGNEKGHPFTGKIVNFGADIYNSNGPAGAQIFGWLPIIVDDEKDKGKKGYINMKHRMYHAAIRKILERFYTAGKTGIMWHCGDDVDRLICPIVLLLTGDYEEQTFFVLIRGLKGLCPCVKCYCPNAKQACVGKFWPLRKWQEVEKIVLDQSLTLTAKEALLKKMGVRDVYSAFWDLPYIDPHKAICFDRLHFNAGGEFSDHLWTEFQKALDDTNRDLKSAIDHQYALFPPWPRLNHFSKVLYISFTDGSKLEDIAKCLSFAAHDALTEDVSPLGYLLLRCIRAYVEHDMYLSFEVHTEDTIAQGRAALIRLERLIEYYCKCNPEKNFTHPKRHWQDHVYDGIVANGVTRIYNTKLFEKLHGGLKKAYAEQTNFRDVGPQLMEIDHKTLTCRIIRANLNVLEEYQEEEELRAKEELEEVKRTSSASLRTLSLGRIYLGSANKRISFQNFEAEHEQDIAYRRFRTRFAKFLKATFSHQGWKDRALKADEKIQEFKYLRVEFESKVTWRTETDLLRCNPQFFGRPRYDGVLVQSEKMFFGILVSIFVFNLSDGDPQPFALIQPLDIPEEALSRKDKHLHLYRLRSAPRGNTIFISLHSIVRGALLLEDPGVKGDFIVMDVADADWFLRCRELFSDVISWVY